MEQTSSTLRESGEAAPAGKIVPTTITVKLPARVHQDEDGSLWADVPALPGCVAGGSDLDEVLANLEEAAEGWLLAKHDVEIRGWPDR
jgi:predicted RNase H-like HicB family nuclease